MTWNRSLTDEERLMLTMFARNATRSEVAERLGCSKATVDRRVDRLRAELGVDTLIQVIVAAVRARLI